MRTLARLSLSALALVIALSCGAAVRADDAAPAKETGTITGRVVDPDGKPVAGAHVRAFVAGAFKDRKKENPSAPKDAPRPEPVAKVDTGADGTFTLENVPVGKVRVLAGLKGTGLGLVKELVDVKSGETAKVGDIQLKKPAGGAGSGGGKPGTDAPKQ